MGVLEADAECPDSRSGDSTPKRAFLLLLVVLVLLAPVLELMINFRWASGPRAALGGVSVAAEAQREVRGREMAVTPRTMETMLLVGMRDWRIEKTAGDCQCLSRKQWFGNHTWDYECLGTTYEDDLHWSEASETELVALVQRPAQLCAKDDAEEADADGQANVASLDEPFGAVIERLVDDVVFDIVDCLGETKAHAHQSDENRDQHDGKPLDSVESNADDVDLEDEAGLYTDLQQKSHERCCDGGCLVRCRDQGKVACEYRIWVVPGAGEVCTLQATKDDRQDESQTVEGKDW